MNIKSGLKVLGLYFKDHAPEILTGVGISGFITTTVLAVRATPKALDAIEEKKAETVKDKIMVAGKYYILPAVTGTLSTVCLVGSCASSKRKNAALAAALTLSEDNLIEYKDKVKEMFGEKKEQHVEEAIAEDRAEKMLPMACPDGIIYTGKGNTLCFDSLTGQTFYSDIESIRGSFNTLNERMFKKGYDEILLNDYTQELGIEDSAVLGTIVGWDSEHGGLELIRGSKLIGNTPCFIIGHGNRPRWLA